MSNEQTLRAALEDFVQAWRNKIDPSSDKWLLVLNNAQAALAATEPTAVQQDDASALPQEARWVDVDVLANFIRTIDGRGSIGAGALAEEIVDFLLYSSTAPQEAQQYDAEYRAGIEDAEQAVGRVGAMANTCVPTAFLAIDEIRALIGKEPVLSVPAEYAAAVSALKLMGYVYTQTDHGMTWVDSRQTALDDLVAESQHLGLYGDEK